LSAIIWRNIVIKIKYLIILILNKNVVTNIMRNKVVLLIAWWYICEAW